MKQTSTLLLCAFTLIACSTIIHAEDGGVPFPVKIGGQEAKPVAGKGYAQIADAVASDAALEVTVKDKAMVICNIAPTTADGNVKEGAVPAIIILQNTNKSALNQTMDKKALVAGTYRINIVADGNTAIINFTVK